MKTDQSRSRSFLACAASLMLVLPMAVVIGGFVGWCVGASVGEWLECIDLPNVNKWSGRGGCLMGAVFCPAIVAHRVARDERSGIRAVNPGKSVE
jgi:hypothetical protein